MAIVYKNGTLIDCTGAAPQAEMTVVVEGDKIQKVCKAGEYAPTEKDNVIDVTGKYIMPGLIDMHEHISYGKMVGPTIELVKRGPVRLGVQGAIRLGKLLDQGITTIRDMGSTDWINLELRDAINLGEIPGPRLYSCGKPLNATGGHFNVMGVIANGPDNVRAAARSVFERGADFLKIMASVDPFKMPGFEQTRPEFTPEEVFAAFDEAHAQGKKAACHCLGSKALGWVIDAGADTIEHACYMTPEQAEKCVKQNIYITPTLSGYTIQTMSEHYGRGEKWKQANLPLVQPFIDTFKMQLKTGVKFILGTDTTGIYAEDVDLMRQYGMEPMQSLITCTKNPADALGMGDKLGTVEVGKLADLIVLEKDPLVNSYNLQTVSHVMKNGEIWK